MANNFFSWPDSLTRFVRFDAARADDVNLALDEVSAGFDDVEIKTNAALKVPDGETAPALPSLALRRGKVLGFNATSGDAEAVVTYEAIQNAQSNADSASQDAIDAAASAAAAAVSAQTAQSAAGAVSQAKNYFFGSL